jgi:catechol 2,3-dioxygenase-like lactoylglutathione lyase family enzyme
MLDHVTLGVQDAKRAIAFYDQAFKALGVARLYGDGAYFAGYGAGPKAFFWIGQRDGQQTGAHIAFACKDRETVFAFHAAALAAGGTDNGQPGLRLTYHPNYFAAYILDPDGHNIEAVCHHPIA